MEYKNKLIAITGSSGFIGRYLVNELQQLGNYRMKLLTRSLDQKLADEYANQNVEVFKGDLQKPETLEGFLEPGCTVINLAYLRSADEAANLEVIANLLKACKAARVKRLIHCSTAEVAGRAIANQITENTPCQPITEYGVTKLKVEQSIIGVKQNCFDVAILRPTVVFGPGGKNLKKLTEDIVRACHLKNYLKLCLFGKRRMNLVSVANVVGAIIFLLRREKNLDGEIFIVSDDDNPINNFADVEKFLMREFQIDDYWLPRIHLPLGLLAFLLGRMGRNNTNPRRNYTPDKLRNLGFKPVITFEAALAEYAAWYRSSQLGII